MVLLNLTKMESTGKNTQCKSSNLNLFCILLRTIAWETDTQIALRNCSEKVVGVSRIYVILSKGFIQSSTHFDGRFYLVMRNRYLRSYFTAFLNMRR